MARFEMCRAVLAVIESDDGERRTGHGQTPNDRRYDENVRATGYLHREIYLYTEYTHTHTQ